jgi:cell division septum initiation protein DivIVA
MRQLACATLLLFATACATAPRPPPLRRRHFEYQLTDLSALGARVQRVNAPGGKAPEYSRIGQADLEQARALLSRARNDLEPQHWALLDRKLSEAEQAWERLARLARTSPEPHVLRGSEGLARASQGPGALSRVGPLLVALVLLWPSSTAGPEEDRRPPWLDAQLELEARLRDVSAASQQVLAQLEAQSALAEAEDAAPEPQPQPAPSKGSPPDLKTRGRSQCEPVPVFPHQGGKKHRNHHRCADVIPPNRFPGHDVLVNGKLFDALQVGVRVLWEIKTDNFDTYSPFLRGQVVRTQVPELQRERDLAKACGYDFVIGVRSEAHKAALLFSDNTLKIIAFDAKRCIDAD